MMKCNLLARVAKRKDDMIDVAFYKDNSTIGREAIPWPCQLLNTNGDSLVQGRFPESIFD